MVTLLASFFMHPGVVRGRARAAGWGRYNKIYSVANLTNALRS